MGRWIECGVESPPPDKKPRDEEDNSITPSYQSVDGCHVH